MKPVVKRMVKISLSQHTLWYGRNSWCDRWIVMVVMTLRNYLYLIKYPPFKLKHIHLQKSFNSVHHGRRVKMVLIETGSSSYLRFEPNSVKMLILCRLPPLRWLPGRRQISCDHVCGGPKRYFIPHNKTHDFPIHFPIPSDTTNVGRY